MISDSAIQSFISTPKHQRTLQVITQLQQGKSNRSVAKTLGMTPQSVDYIFNKYLRNPYPV